DLRSLYFNDKAQVASRPFVSGPGVQMPFPAPEAAAELTPASDVYSLGASLLALVGGGTPPFGAQAKPAGPLAANRKLWDVLRRAVEADPALRYPDGHALALALNDSLPAPRTVT